MDVLSSANPIRIVPAAAPVFQHPHRLLCTKSIDAPLSANAAGTTSIFTRFWRWLNDEVEEKVMPDLVTVCVGETHIMRWYCLGNNSRGEARERGPTEKGKSQACSIHT